VLGSGRGYYEVEIKSFHGINERLSMDVGSFHGCWVFPSWIP
jgi:hypothetical protein